MSQPLFEHPPAVLSATHWQSVSKHRALLVRKDKLQREFERVCRLCTKDVPFEEVLRLHVQESFALLNDDLSLQFQQKMQQMEQQQRAVTENPSSIADEGLSHSNSLQAAALSRFPGVTGFHHVKMALMWTPVPADMAVQIADEGFRGQLAARDGFLGQRVYLSPLLHQACRDDTGQLTVMLVCVMACNIRAVLRDDNHSDFAQADCVYVPIAHEDPIDPDSQLALCTAYQQPLREEYFVADLSQLLPLWIVHLNRRALPPPAPPGAQIICVDCHAAMSAQTLCCPHCHSYQPLPDANTYYLPDGKSTNPTVFR
eukprot:TRINITY_DN10754_c0_g1_i1.p1 TRINITY_DN10754_c0_g1~~TRINITY_DN10754_c0_g1_i1.p1  ORF type:complete len:314 (-),score=72.97 TRINITY_DN10754_c0_g1_i1:801-1742(-)